MPRCIILCAGERGTIDALSPAPGDLILCCDGGWDVARELGLVPDLLLGDFDSIQGPLPEGIEILRFPVEKDDTDSMLAVREGLRRGCDAFELYFSLGGRLDHTVANIQTLAFLREAGASGTLFGPRDTVRLLGNETLTLRRDKTRTLSVFAYGGPARGVTLRGVRYPLTDALLTTGFPLGLGNHIVEEEAEVTVADGRLLVVTSVI